MDHTARIIELIERLDSRLDEIDKTLVRQEANLKHHVYRAEANEKRLERIEGDIEPIKAHVSRLNGAFIMVGLTATVIAILTATVKLFGK
jgi:predicted  nucleic acid-binding Zn-ribbon protein